MKEAGLRVLTGHKGEACIWLMNFEDLGQSSRETPLEMRRKAGGLEVYKPIWLTLQFA